MAHSLASMDVKDEIRIRILKHLQHLCRKEKNPIDDILSKEKKMTTKNDDHWREKRYFLDFFFLTIQFNLFIFDTMFI